MPLQEIPVVTYKLAELSASHHTAGTAWLPNDYKAENSQPFIII